MPHEPIPFELKKIILHVGIFIFISISLVYIYKIYRHYQIRQELMEIIDESFIENVNSFEVIKEIRINLGVDRIKLIYLCIDNYVYIYNGTNMFQFFEKSEKEYPRPQMCDRYTNSTGGE